MSVWSAILDFFKSTKVQITKVLPTGYWKWTMKPNGYKPTWIVIHHSMSTDGVIRDFDSIRRYHMSHRYQGEIITKEQYDAYAAQGKTKGLEKPWSDIGYHFVVENIAGKVEVLSGRPIGSEGAHCLGFNDRSIGICFIGNFDTVAPNSDLLFTGSSLCRQLCREFEIPTDQVIGHRESFVLRGTPVQKTCPGKAFDMNLFRERIDGVKH